MLPLPAPAVSQASSSGTRSPSPHCLLHVLSLFPLACCSHAPGNMPHAPQWCLARDVADLWGPVTNQSTPGQAKHVCTLLWHTLVGPLDITATHHVLTSFATQLRWTRLPGRRCSPWESKPRNKALVGSRPFPVEGRNIWDLLPREETIPGTEVSTGLSVPPRQGTQHSLHHSCPSQFPPQLSRECVG